TGALCPTRQRSSIAFLYPLADRAQRAPGGGAGMSTWRMLGRLIGFTPGLYALTLGLQIPRFVLMLAPGLISKQLFDYFTSDASHTPAAQRWFWFLIALIVVVAMIRSAIVLSSIF